MTTDLRARSLRAFALTATIEAVTWGGLLVGMFVKHVLGLTEAGVWLFGRLHGAAFIAYCLSAILVWRIQRWNAVPGLLALAASLPPFGTVVFHRWAVRSGRLEPCGDAVDAAVPVRSAPAAPDTRAPEPADRRE